MFDWQTPGYPEDIDRELRLVDQDETDRIAQHSPSPNGLDGSSLSAPRTNRPDGIPSSSVPSGHTFPEAA